MRSHQKSRFRKQVVETFCLLLWGLGAFEGLQCARDVAVSDLDRVAGCPVRGAPPHAARSDTGGVERERDLIGFGRAEVVAQRGLTGPERAQDDEPEPD